MLKLKNEFKEEIKRVLELYKEGEVYTFLPENKEKMMNSVKPYYHKSEKTWEGRRIRFNICSENSWNKITLDENQKENILNKCKEILTKYGIQYKTIRLTSYYPYIESRMQYASWNRCLEIICEA